MEALKDLERRYRLKVAKRPEGPPIEEPKDKSSSTYESEAWSDVTRVLPMLERKLLRLRDRVSLNDYVKFCRLLDRVTYDFDKSKGESTPAMIEALSLLRNKM
ncbi:MAG: hypothetical protein ACWGQW_11485, partial [bacterium]